MPTVYSEDLVKFLDKVHYKEQRGKGLATPRPDSKDDWNFRVAEDLGLVESDQEIVRLTTFGARFLSEVI